MLRKIRNLFAAIRYCIANRLPVIKSVILLRKVRKKESISIRTLIMIDYLKKGAGTFMLHREYMENVWEINGSKNLVFLRDKEIIFKRCPELMGRKYLNITNSTEEDIINFIESRDILVAKKNFGFGGKQFRIYDKKKLTTKEIYAKIKEDDKDLLEEYIVQHPELARVYPFSVNTIRIHTVGNGREVKIFLEPKLRFGSDQNVIDMGENSYRAIVNMDGSLKNAIRYSRDKDEKAEYHHNTKVYFKEVRVPYVEEMLELVKKGAASFPELRFIGWDVAITERGPIIVEGNSISGSFMQYQRINWLYHGKGLRKELEEMFAYAKEEKVQEKQSPGEPV